MSHHLTIEIIDLLTIYIQSACMCKFIRLLFERVLQYDVKLLSIIYVTIPVYNLIRISCFFFFLYLLLTNKQNKYDFNCDYII